MKTMPFFRWFPKEAITDIDLRSMTLEERGLFHVCLDYAWINDGLPMDLEKLRKILDIDPRKFRRLWGKVGLMFLRSSGDFEEKFRNLRQEVERKYVQSRSVKAIESVKTRYERTTRESNERSSIPDNRYQITENRQQEKHFSRSEAVRQGPPEINWDEACFKDSQDEKKPAPAVRPKADIEMSEAELEAKYGSDWRIKQMRKDIERAKAG